MERLRKHQYVPVFYLQQWADDRGRLLKFSRPYGPVVKHEPTSPRKTGYQRGLYRVPNVPEHLAKIIEQGFMKETDDLAALVLRDFIAKRLEGWTVPRREAWSRFIVGLNKRVVRNAITYVWDTGLTNEVLNKGQLDADAASDPRYF